MRRWGGQPEIHLDAKELSTDLKSGRRYFVGSGTDMFAEDVPASWISDVLRHCMNYTDNTYLFQSKNPLRFKTVHSQFGFPEHTVLATTIETNRKYPQMGKVPTPRKRAEAMYHLFILGYPTMVTIEPIMDFDVKELVNLVRWAKPGQVNIGADSKGHSLPEPSQEKIDILLKELRSFVKTVYLKPNLRRLYISF